MIFHIPTRTAIFTPPKTGSVSLHLATRSHREFVACHGPKPWDRKAMSPHCATNDVDRVDDDNIERRVLLIRRPVDRIVSLWRHLTQRGEISAPFSAWLEAFTDSSLSGGWRSMRSYCRIHDDVVRTESMFDDLFRLTGVRIVERRDNQSTAPRPEPSGRDVGMMRYWYGDDFELWDSLA